MENSFEYTQVEKMLSDMAYEKKTPFSGSLELTPYCNLACKMCYVKEVAPGLRLLKGEQWLEIGRQAAQMGVLWLKLTGGEPLLHPDFRMIYAGLKEMGFVLSVNTNGTMIDEAMADFLAENMPRRVCVSLYGSCRETYEELCGVGDAFDRVIRGIELLRQRQIPVMINLTPNTINYRDMGNIFDLCKKYDLPVQMTPYLFEPVRTSASDQQHYRLSVEQMADVRFLLDWKRKEKYEFMAACAKCFMMLEHFEDADSDETLPMPCGAGANMFWLGWNGRMNVCGMINQQGADVLELGFGEAWEQMKAFREEIRVPKRCASCSLFSVCNPCAAVNLHETGKTSELAKEFCRSTQEYARLMASKVHLTEKTKTERNKP